MSFKSKYHKILPFIRDCEQTIPMYQGSLSQFGWYCCSCQI